MDDKKVGRPDISLREIVNQLKKNAEGQHKDFLAGAVLNRKELNDLEQGINRLNKNLEKLTKIISSSSVLEKSMSIQSKGARRFSGGTAEVVTNPQMGRMLREDKKAINVKDLFGNFINKDSRSPDNFFFQSGSQARQREELRIKLKKGEIDQEEFDKSNEQIGKAGGFKDFFKDFKAGLQDVSNFFTNKNKIQTEESLKKSEEKQKEITPQADKKSEVLDKILGEVNTIRKILENNLKKPKSEGRERRKSDDVKPGTDLAVIRRKPIVKRNLLGDSSNVIDVLAKEVKRPERRPGRILTDNSKVIDVAAKEVKKPLLLSGPSGPSQVQSSSVPVSPAPIKKDSDALDVEPKPTQEPSSPLIGDVNIAGGIASTAGSVAKAGSKLGGFLKGAGRVLGKAALPLALATTAYEGVEGFTQASENLDIKDREATLGEKLSSAGGSIVSGLTFGLLDKKDTSKSIAKFFGAGPNEKEGPVPNKTVKGTMIAGEPVLPDQPLSEKQLRVMEMAMDMGNTYPPEIMKKYKDQKNVSAKQSSVEAVKKSEDVTPLSEENSTLKEKNANRSSNTVINNVSQAPAQEASSAVGPAPTTRPPESALEKYLDRQAVFA